MRSQKRTVTHHLASLCALLDVHYKFLLLLLELGALSVELALRLCEGALMLPKPLSRRDGPSKQSLLYMERRQRDGVQHDESAYDDVHWV